MKTATLIFQITSPLKLFFHRTVFNGKVKEKAFKIKIINLSILATTHTQMNFYSGTNSVSSMLLSHKPLNALNKHKVIQYRTFVAL